MTNVLEKAAVVYLINSPYPRRTTFASADEAMAAAAPRTTLKLADGSWVFVRHIASIGEDWFPAPKVGGA
jgi:hypothetical protein